MKIITIILPIFFYPISLLIHYGMQSDELLRMIASTITIIGYAGIIGHIAGKAMVSNLKDEIIEQYKNKYYENTTTTYKRKKL